MFGFDDFLINGFVSSLELLLVTALFNVQGNQMFKMKLEDSILLRVRRNDKASTFRFITSYHFDVFIIDLYKFFNDESFLLD